MTSMAKELLQKLSSSYDNTRKNDFDFSFYVGYPETVIDELVHEGCIVKQTDIVGTIKLTEFGYDEAKK